MTEELVIKLTQDALRVTALLSAPILVSTLVIGLVISVFQALTQINEQTLTFIPKIMIVGIVIILAGPWMLDIMTHYTIDLFENIVTMVRE